MGKTFNVNTHLLQLRYVIQGMTHKMQFHVNARPAGDSYVLKAHDDTELPIDDVLAFLAPDFGPLMPLAAASGGSTLYERVEGTLVPVWSPTWAFTPGTAPVKVAQGETYFFRDIQMVAMKVSVISETIGACYKALSPIAAGNIYAPAEDFILELYTDDAEHFGGFWNSLAGNGPHMFISWVADSNEKVRRLRGVK